MQRYNYMFTDCNSYNVYTTQEYQQKVIRIKYFILACHWICRTRFDQELLKRDTSLVISCIYLWASNC